MMERALLGRFIEDDWRDVCREKPRKVAYVLLILAKNQIVPVGRCRTALQVWSEEALVLQSWRYLRALLPQLGEDGFKELLPKIAWWLNAADKLVVEDDRYFISLSRKIIESAEAETERPDEPVGAAINHPVGHATQGVVQLLRPATG